MFASKLTSLAVLLASVGPALAGWGHVYNNCPETIWCKTVNQKGHDSPPQQINGRGGHYVSTIRARNGNNDDKEGVTVKCGRTPQVIGAPHYQLEWKHDPDWKTWYDLSAIDGRIFGDRARYVQYGAAGECPSLYCKPGEFNPPDYCNTCQNPEPPKLTCEWSTMGVCYGDKDLALYFC